MVSHISAGDIWLALSLIMIPVEFLTGTTIAIGSGIAFGFTGLIALVSFGVVDVFEQWMVFLGLMSVIQTGAYFLYRQRVRVLNHKASLLAGSSPQSK